MDSKPEHFEHNHNNTLSPNEQALNGESHSHDSNKPVELSARKNFAPHNDEGKDSEYDFEQHADHENDLLRDNGEGLPVSEESEHGALHNESDEQEEEPVQSQLQARNDSEREYDNNAVIKEEQKSDNQQPESEKEELSDEPHKEDEKLAVDKLENEQQEMEVENVDAENSNDDSECKQSSMAEVREEESHRMEVEDVDHAQHEQSSEHERYTSPPVEQAPSEQQEQHVEPEPAQQQKEDSDRASEQIEHAEEPKVQQKVPVKKQQRGRRGKRAISAEPQLAKRATPPTVQPEPEEEASVQSDRGAYAKEHELRHLGKEIHRSTTSVVYLADSPIDATHFGQCIVKQRLPAKRKISARPSEDAIRQEVANMTKAKNMGVPVPAVYSVNINRRLLCLEYFKNATPLREYLAVKSDDYDDDTIAEMRKLFTALGSHIAEMHNGNVVHGSLSVDSVLLEKAKLSLRLISFGASTTSGSIEEKAADLYALVRSFPSTPEEHMRYSDLTHCVFTGYTAKSSKLDSVVQRVQKIKQKMQGQAR